MGGNSSKLQEHVSLDTDDQYQALCTRNKLSIQETWKVDQLPR
mgnify:CR=1 FL=1